MRLGAPALLLAVAGIAACRLPAHVTEAGRPEGVIGVAALEQNRAALKGQVVRVEGFLIESPRSIDLVDGHPRPQAAAAGRVTSWCQAQRPGPPLWMFKRELRRIWRSIRPRDRMTGVHVIVEGRFDDWNVPPFDANGESNSLVTMTGDLSLSDGDAPPGPGEYLGIGPLREVRLLRVFRDLCSGDYPRGSAGRH